eukprot:jgi/Chrzof1/3475/Cz12g26270.t1_PAC[v5.2]
MLRREGADDMQQQQQQQQQQPEQQAEDYSLPDHLQVGPEEYKRKASILLELLAAGPQLDDKLAQFRSEIDELMLLMLSRRLELTQKMQQEPDVISHLEGMYDIVRVQYERSQASPAMRLLDDVMDILGDDSSALDYGQRRADASNRMRDAFTGGASQQIDIFAAAAALAADGAKAAEALCVEAVSPVAFLAETAQLQAQAKLQQQELQQMLQDFRAELKWVQDNKPDMLQQQQVQQRISQMQAAEQLLTQRTAAIIQLDDVMKIASSIDLSAGGLATSQDMWSSRTTPMTG